MATSTYSVASFASIRREFAPRVRPALAVVGRLGHGTGAGTARPLSFDSGAG